MASQNARPPLAGIKVVEFAGLAPGPFAGMVLADFGAEVIRIDRPGETASSDILARGKRSLAISPKHAAGRKIILDLICRSDVLIDPFRPGTLEKLGLGPEECLKHNPRLIYARLTGYKRTGPYSLLAGHDINYAALSGVLAMLRPGGGVPTPPMNLLADFAGGGSVCVLGILMALIARTSTGRGQVVETDMVSGTRYISSFPLALRAEKSPYFSEPAGHNILDGGAPFYAVYETADRKFISVGALEPRFYSIFLDTLMTALDDDRQRMASVPEIGTQYDRDTWPSLRSFLQQAFGTKSRDEWEQIFLGTDSCVAPVLEPEEVSMGGKTPKSAPTLRDTPAMLSHTKSLEEHYLIPGKDSAAILAALGVDKADIGKLISEGIVSQSKHERSKL